MSTVILPTCFSVIPRAYQSSQCVEDDQVLSSVQTLGSPQQGHVMESYDLRDT